jgi:hypothetical protein
VHRCSVGHCGAARTQLRPARAYAATWLVSNCGRGACQRGAPAADNHVAT